VTCVKTRMTRRSLTRPSLRHQQPSSNASPAQTTMDAVAGTPPQNTPPANLIDLAASLAIPAAILAHLLASPYTKVEESFNIQAIHDIATYGPAALFGSDPHARYDHVDFPGAVPRTCVGALGVAALAKPLLGITASPLAAQVAGTHIQGMGGGG
jgi:hypothetical protein